MGFGFSSKRHYTLYTADWDTTNSQWINPVATPISGDVWNGTEGTTFLTYDASQLPNPCFTIARIIDTHWVWLNGEKITQVMLRNILMSLTKKDAILSQNTDLAKVSGFSNKVKVYGYVNSSNITIPDVPYTQQIFQSSDILITAWDTNYTIPTTDNILGKVYILDTEYKAFIVKVEFDYWLEMVNIDDPDSCGWDDPRYAISCTSHAEGWLGVYDPSTQIIASGGGELIAP